MSLREFADGDELAAALAAFVADALVARLAQHGTAALAVSGGTTPTKFLHDLSIHRLDWHNVTVTLVDDRVTRDPARSNERLIRDTLLQHEAAAASFLPLVTDLESPELNLPVLEAALADLALPFAAVVLGMGVDGHTASFFPNGDGLAAALEPHEHHRAAVVRAEAAGEPRVTLALPPLLQTAHLAIHIEGAEKRAALDAALAEGPVWDMPVRAVLRRQPPPEIFWSP